VFQKDRAIDQMRHQLKHGVIAQNISSTFNHAHDGKGGSIFSGNLSKIEKAELQQQMLSDAQYN
jgi:hypothetical protein